MLKAMRHAAKTWLAYGLFILLILSFGIWGVGDMVKSNPQQRTAIEIGSLKIPVSELDKEFMNSFEQARQFFGTTFTREQAKQAGLLQQSVNNMIERELMTMKLKDYGFALGRNSALRELASVPGLNDGGKLNRAMFEQLLRQNNMTEDQLMAVLATERARDLFLDTLLVGTVVSAPAVDVLSASRSQRRHAEVLEVLHDRQQAPAAPADDVLKNFLETNATMFMRPERRDIDVLHVDGEQLKTTLTIGDDELKKSYDDNMAEFMTPATDTFLQVISSDEAVAKKIADGAKKLSSLNDYATAEKLDVQRMDGVSARDNLPPLVDALKKLDQGAISQPIQTAFGWHVVEKISSTPEKIKSFDEVREQLKDRLQQEKLAEAMNNMIARVEDAMAAEQPMAEIAANENIGHAALKAMAKDDTLPPNAPGWLSRIKNLQAEAFALAEGETSALMDDGNNGLVAYRVVAVQAAALPDLSEVKERVLAEWQKAEQARMAMALAQTLASHVREGKKMSDQTGDGVQQKNFRPFSLLQRAESDMPANVQEALLQLGVGDITTVQGGTASYVVRLAKVEDGPQPSTSERDALANELTRHWRGDVYAAFEKTWRAQHPVIIKQDVIDSLYTNAE